MGFFSNNTDYVTISVLNANLNPTSIPNQNVNISADGTFPITPINISSLNPEIYNFIVQGHTTGGTQTAVSAFIFDSLLVEDLSNTINNLNSDLSSIDGNIDALWDDSNNQWVDINQAKIDIVTINNDLIGIYADITRIDNNLIANEARMAQIEFDLIDMNIDVNKNTNDINNLKNRATSLETRVGAVETKLKAMNSSTITIRFRQGDLELDVFGEAPLGTTNATIYLKKAIDGNIVYSDSAPILNGSGNDSRYAFNATQGNPVILTGKDKIIYNVEVHFGGLPGSYKSVTIFGELLVLAIQERLTFLENKVETLNDGTIAFDYNSVNNKLKVFGEIPSYSKCVKVEAISASGDNNYSKFDSTVSPIAGSNDYQVRFNTSGWPKVVTNIYSSFYNDVNCTDLNSVTSNTFVGLLSEETYGIHNINVNSYVTKIGNYKILVPISASLKVETDGLYDLSYSLDNKVTWEVFSTNNTFNEGKLRYFYYNLDINDFGLKRVRLKAVETTTGKTYTSHKINVRVDDVRTKLKAKIKLTPKNNSKLVYRNTDGNVVNLPWPFGSVTNKVYWTHSGDVNLAAVITTNATINDWCSVSVLKKGTNTGTPVYNIFSTSKNLGICESPISTDDWNENREGTYSIIKVVGIVSGTSDPIGDLNVGIDDEIPDINVDSIRPDAKQIMVGTYRWNASITDNLSGIKKVKFYLIEKQDVNYCKTKTSGKVVCHLGAGAIKWSKRADFNSINGLFYKDLNTLKWPNGDYNVAFDAIDVAGNYAREEIDPIIDNTAPVITINSITTPVRRGIDAIDVNVSVNDKFLAAKYSGVDKVWAKITNDSNAQDTNRIMLTQDGNYYIGTFTTDVNWDLNTYTIVIDANDRAGNDAIPQSGNTKVIPNYYFNLSTPAAKAANAYFVLSDGNFRDDLGIVPTLPDKNAIMFSGSAITAGNVEFDGNGKYTVTTDPLTQGSYIIDLNYNTKDYNYTDQITITVGPAPIVTPGGRGPSSSGGGIQRDVCGNNICSDTESYETCPADCNAPVETDTNEPVVERPSLFPEGFEEPTPIEPTPAEPELEIVTVEPGVEQPQGPTGFFGLGMGTDLGVGLIILLGMIGGVFIVWKKKF